MADFRISTAIAAVDRISRPVRRISALVSTRLAGAFRATARAAGRAALAIGKAGVRLAKYGAVVAAGGLTVAHRVAEDTAEMSRFARQVGLSVEALQEYGFAAKSVGVESLGIATEPQ